MGLTREEKVLKNLKGNTKQPPTVPIMTGMFVPNHSGDHSAGQVISTPTENKDIVNKEYVDGEITSHEHTFIRDTSGNPSNYSSLTCSSNQVNILAGGTGAEIIDFTLNDSFFSNFQMSLNNTYLYTAGTQGLIFESEYDINLISYGGVTKVSGYFSLLDNDTTGGLYFCNSSGYVAQDRDNIYFDTTYNRLGINTSGTAICPISVGTGSFPLQQSMQSKGISVSSTTPILYGAENTSASGASGGSFMGLYHNDGALLSNADRLGGIIFGAWTSLTTMGNTAGIVSYASENWSGSGYGTDLTFENTTNASTGRSEKMRVTNAGKVGIGTNTPMAGTTVTPPTSACLDIEHANNSDPLLRMGVNGNTYFTFWRNTSTGALHIQGNQASYNNISVCPSSGLFAVGVPEASTPSAKLQVRHTTEQVRVEYDASNYLSCTVGSNGQVTYNATGSGANHVFSDSVEIDGDLNHDGTNVGLYNVTPVARATTAGTASTFTANTSGIADDTATFDGYTLGQVIKALRNIGILT
jgi:hypothetical protein